MLLAVPLLGGCAEGKSLDLMEILHSTQDGPIAGVRAPPPGADQPYPNLGTIPPRPTVPDLATRTRFAGGLAADRDDAHYAAGLAPIGTVPKPAPPPPPPAPAADSDEASGATLAAASAPAPAPATVATPVPVPLVRGAAAPMPSIPDAPPPPPSFAGVPAVTAPAPPPKKPAPPPVVLGPRMFEPVAIAFAPESAVLPGDAAGLLGQMARGRGSRDIRVTGFGDATGTDAASQAAALPLALARAQSMAANLQAAGVPIGSILLDAQALGRGGVAQVGS